MWYILVSFCSFLIADSEFIKISYLCTSKKVTKQILSKSYHLKIAKTKNTIILVRKLKIEQFKVFDYGLSYFYIKSLNTGLHSNFDLCAPYTTIELSGFKKDIVFNSLGYLRHTNDAKVPFERTQFGLARLSVLLPKFM